jgi:DNA-binding PadR family transcriptional regulator
MSLATLKVLGAFLDRPNAEHYGLSLIDSAGIKGGTLYPILSRLEQAGWIDGYWEDINEKAEGRRKRRYYRLTALGEREALSHWNATLASRGPRLREAGL